MYCKACGKQIDDDSAFCKVCGAPQGAVVSTAEAVRPWETCEIKFTINKARVFKASDLRFFAEAVAPKGIYVCGSIDYRGDYTDAANFNRSIGGYDERYSIPVENEPGRAALNSLIQQLGRDGWEPVQEKGKEWYSYRFRRQVK